MSTGTSTPITDTSKCSYCGDKFSPLLLGKHLDECHSHAQFGCCLCLNQLKDSGDGKTGRFDNYHDVRHHLVATHCILPAANDSNIADQLISIPVSSCLSGFLCTWCQGKFLGQSEDSLKEHFRDFHSSPIFLPNFVKRFCRICSFDSAKSEEEMTSHIESAHERSRFWVDSEAEKKAVILPKPKPVLKPNPVAALIMPNSALNAHKEASSDASSVKSMLPPKTSNVLTSLAKSAASRRSVASSDEDDDDILEMIIGQTSDTKKSAASGTSATPASAASIPAIKKDKTDKKSLRKRKSDTDDSSSSSSDSSSSEEETKKKSKKRKKSAKKSKKKSKKRKVAKKRTPSSSDSSNSSSDNHDDESSSSDEDDKVSGSKLADSDKKDINLFLKKKQQIRERMSLSLEKERERSLEAAPKGEFNRGNSHEAKRGDVITKNNDVIDPSHKSRADHAASDLEEGETTSVANQSRRSVESDYRRRRHSSHDSDHSGSYRRSRRESRSDSADSRRSKHRRRRYSDDYSDDDGDDSRRRRASQPHHQQNYDQQVGGYCDDCNLRLQPGRVREHFSSSGHLSQRRMRCFLCNKAIQNARDHLESMHQSDIFRCNVRNCLNPKFVEARKVLDHLDHMHRSLTQGKTMEQLVRDGFLTLPQNLEVHSCSKCKLAFGSQPLDTVLTHMKDRCCIANPRQCDVIFTCRFCGPRRVFDNLAQLQKHCVIHLEAARDCKNNPPNNSAVHSQGRSRSPASPTRGGSATRTRRYSSRSNDGRRSRSRSRSDSRSPSHHRRTSSSEREDKSLGPRYSCYFCSFTTELSANRDHHVKDTHGPLLFTCKACDSKPFKAVNLFDVYIHLNEVHKRDETEQELNKFVLNPPDLRKIVCLVCKEYEAMENSQWLCRDPHEVAGDLKDHLLCSHKNIRVVSKSFGLRCSACNVHFSYDEDYEWTKHLKSAHKDSSAVISSSGGGGGSGSRTVVVVKQPSPSQCSFCPKQSANDSHVLEEHADMVFRCRRCSLNDNKNWFRDFPEIRRHCITEHNARDVASRLSEYVLLPMNLTCPVCKFCSSYLHGQSLRDLEDHFRLEHPMLGKISMHMDFCCRICMSSDVHESFDELERHVNDAHRNLIHDQQQHQQQLQHHQQQQQHMNGGDKQLDHDHYYDESHNKFSMTFSRRSSYPRQPRTPPMPYPGSKWD